MVDGHEVLGYVSFEPVTAPRWTTMTVTAKEQKIDVDGEVVEALPSGTFPGRMRRARVRVLPGDRVKVQLSPYDLRRGRLVHRYH